MGLRRKTVLITGGGQGIGRGMAEHFLELGASVVIAEIDDDASRETVEELGSRGAIRSVRCDVREESDVERAVTFAVEAFGALDGLVNNAGVADPGSIPVENLPLATWRLYIDSHLTGAFLCAKHAAPRLRERRGAIVNISSTRALQSEPRSEAYAAAKGGMLALTHALAISLGPDVRANAICPGWIDVSLLKKFADRSPAELRPIDHAQHPAGRVGNARDIAALAAFLLSDESRFITAQTFIVDGGMTRRMTYAE